ncbi:LysE family translocator [Ichthyobacterium seriolicida]|nr:LysE family translocator [Ichthyobacterium seriolicida]
MGLLLSFLMGPVFFILIETSVTRGFKAALIFDLGVISADIVFILVSLFGSKPMIDAITENSSFLLIGGGALIVYGATYIFKKDKGEYRDLHLRKVNNNYLALFLKGLLLNISNMSVFIFWLSVVIAVATKISKVYYEIFACFLSIILTYLLIDIFKIFLAKRFKKKLTNKRIYKIKSVTGYLLIFFGLLLIIKTVFHIEETFNIKS